MIFIAFFLLLLSLTLSIPAVQSRLAKIATEQINNDFKVDLQIEKVDLSLLGSVKLEDVAIKDHHKDTLVFVKSLRTSLLNVRKIIDNKVNLGSASLNGVRFYMKTYKGEKDDNMSVFLDKFEEDTPKNSTYTPFILKSSDIYIEDLTYVLTDENKHPSLQFSAIKAGGNLQEFSLIGPNVSTKIRGLYFTDDRGLEVTNLTTDFKYTKKDITLKKTILQTQKSKVEGNIKMSYKREDFANFTDKVMFNANFKKAQVSIKDLKKFYNELSGNDILYFTGKLKGTLNNFDVKKLNLRSKNGIKMFGDLSLINSFKNERGVVFESNINNITANYNQLKNILPNILGKALPTEFKRLGTFSLNGNVFATPDQMKATLTVVSEIGNVISDLELANIDDIDNAEYNGEIEFENFDAGVFFNDNLLGKISLKGDVEGSGFKISNIDTRFIGEISKFHFKGYDYTNLKVNGEYQNNRFNGDLIANDKNFKVDFKGLADLSKEKNKFDFKADITHLNLQKTNLFTRDSISKIKGKIDIDITGNTLDDLNGKAIFKNIEYLNQNDNYKFKNFEIASIVKDSLQTIKINSEDIVEGQLSGKFLFQELLPVAQNALGSIYTNYTPYPVQPNQYIRFNFVIYNKIVEVFLPEVSVGKNTRVFGRIDSNKNLLKLNIRTPKLKAFGNEIEKLVLRTDNQNPVYNSHLTADKISTKYYDVYKLNLLNRTKNDTLFFKSVFKGGTEKNGENYNVDFFYTINPEEKSVIGLEKSNFSFKGNKWEINPTKEFQSKVSYHLAENVFEFSPFKLTAGNQEIKFSGTLNGTDNKSLQASFNKVNLTSILPKIDSLDLQGELSGAINFTQKKGIYQPKGNVKITNFIVNNYKQGDLSLNIKGNKSYEQYDVNLALQHQSNQTITGNGILDFSTEKPLIDFSMALKEFQLNAFSPLGEDVLSNIRGKASGSFTLRGFLQNPEMDGTLTLKDAGLKFPYLNTDYSFKNNATIGLSEQQFIFEDIILQDTKFNTEARLLGSITHQNFEAWFFDLEIDTNNLLVFNTEETEESIYYGTGFLNGTAAITGLSDKLTIDVNGKTNKGTKFILPIKDVETIDNYRLIHFKTDANKVRGIRQTALEAVKGLSLNIDLEVTEDAEAQIVIDKVNGSQLTGRSKGNIKIEIDTRDKFNMYGDLAVQSGIYDFKYSGILNKPFKIQKGGTVSWSGSPFDADLNIIAIHRLKANPRVLLENFTSTRNIEVDLIAKITGNLFNSKQELDIEMPKVNPTIASELEFKLNRNNINEKTTQFVSLLAFGRFVNSEDIFAGSDDMVASTATSALAAAFSNLLNTPDGKFQLGVDYQQGQTNDIENVRSDDQVDVSVSTQISDRVLVNGTVGVPLGGKTQTSIVGEVKVEVLLNEKGNFRATAFNKPNDIDYSLENEGYTQGIGLSYQVNFNNAKELLEKIGLKKVKKTKNGIKKDTIITPHKKLINIGKRKMRGD